MNLQENMNQALKYIDSCLKLDGKIDMQTVQKLSGQTPKRFSIFFSTVANITLNEYLHRRRLCIAAQAVQNTDKHIFNIALQSGYSSPEAFSRAFKNEFGISPKQARQSLFTLPHFSKFTFDLTN